jgi:2-keto-3-deoxy-L-rhamnonate aldolase RhmA
MRRDVGTNREGGSPAYTAALDDAVVVLMVEKRQCVEDLDAILAVPGIDMVQFGGSDYAMSIGQTGNRAHKDVRAAEVKTIETALKLGIHPRIEIAEPDQAAPYIEMGVKHFCIGWDVGILSNFWATRGTVMQDLLAGAPKGKVKKGKAKDIY